MIDINPTTYFSPLKPLENTSDIKAFKGNKSELTEFAKYLAQASEPAIRSRELQTAHLAGKANIDEVKIAQAEEAIALSLAVKTTEKIVHSIEATLNMQI